MISSFTISGASPSFFALAASCAGEYLGIASFLISTGSSSSSISGAAFFFGAAFFVCAAGLADFLAGLRFWAVAAATSFFRSSCASLVALCTVLAGRSSSSVSKSSSSISSTKPPVRILRFSFLLRLPCALISRSSSRYSRSLRFSSRLSSLRLFRAGAFHRRAVGRVVRPEQRAARGHGRREGLLVRQHVKH